MPRFGPGVDLRMMGDIGRESSAAAGITHLTAVCNLSSVRVVVVEGDSGGCRLGALHDFGEGPAARRMGTNVASEIRTRPPIS